MTKQELNTTLDYFINSSELGITVYVVLKNDNTHTPKKLDIEDDDLSDLLELFQNQIKEEIVAKESIGILNISSSDERTNVIYKYDLDVPDELNVLEDVIQDDTLPLFNLKSDNLTDITALLIEIGNDEQQLVLYKKIWPVNVYGRQGYFLKKSSERFEKINDEFMRIDPSFHLFRINSNLYVIDLKVLERFFGFHDVIKKEAQASVSAIKEIEILKNPETLEELIDDISFARKLTKIAKSSPVLIKGIPNAHIISFSKNHPAVKNKIKYNEDSTQMVLDTKVSKSLFIKILNDDLLTSELTNLYYESLAKNGVQVIEED